MSTEITKKHGPQKPSSYKVIKSDKDLLSRTRRSWLAQLRRYDIDIPPTRYLQALSFAMELVAGKHDSVYSYAVVSRSDPGKAHALLDISHARPQSNAPWLKVLSIRMEPRLDVANTDQKIREVSAIAACSLVGSLVLTLDAHPSKELKVYGERPLDRSFLEGIVTNLPKLKMVDVSTHGNWLVIRQA